MDVDLDRHGTMSMILAIVGSHTTALMTPSSMVSLKTLKIKTENTIYKYNGHYWHWVKLVGT